MNIHPPKRKELLAFVLALALTLSSSMTGWALPPIPPDDGMDPIGGTPFEPPSNGFYWSVPNRFGNDNNHDGMMDFNWIENGDYDPNGHYDPAYVHPNGFPANFNGCQTSTESSNNLSTNTYRWRFLYPGEADDAPGRVIEGFQCRIQYTFPSQATYRVQLTILQPDNTVILDKMQEVVIKDYLIISIGDSFASGEGNPDIPGEMWWEPVPLPGFFIVNKFPRWQYARCGRSQWSGPAQAAVAIERSDPHTSVTFLSFACSGATIETPDWQDMDSTKPRGVGILQPYRGSELPLDYSYNDSTFIPSQIWQVQNAVGNRPIDALIISGGGNDIRFGTVAANCVGTANCWINSTGREVPGGTEYRLDELVSRALAALPGKFDDLAREVANLHPANVFITEYPDLTASDTPNAANELDRYCNLVYDILWPWEISRAEAKTAAVFALGGLNREVKAAADNHANEGWVFVGGIADQFRGSKDGKGHGYCASDAWIRSASDSFGMQGPFWPPYFYMAPLTTIKKWTQGTLHPTARGHQVYAERLREEMLPRLNPVAPNTPPPSFSASLTSDTSTSRQGQNGWLTGRCVGATCTSDKAVLRVDAAAQGGAFLRGSSVTINDVSGCSGVPGISCSTSTGAGSLTYTWSFDITQTGIYRLQFLAQDSNLQTTTYAYEVKVDLNDPTASAVIPEETPSSAGWYSAPVQITLTGNDAQALSGVSSVQYTLDGTVGEALSGDSLSVTTDGAHSLTYQTSDNAGRQSSLQTLNFQIDQTAPTTTLAAVSNGAYQSGSWTNKNIQVTLSAADNPSGSGVTKLTYSASGAQLIDSTTIAGDKVELEFSTEGETTLTYSAEDAAGNVESTQSFTLRIDKSAPQVACDAADSAWHANDVSISCSASDSGSGFAGGPTKTIHLTTSVAAGTETANASTDSQQVCDLAGNCATAGPVAGNKVDKKAPGISIASPTGASYLLNQSVASDYTCADGGSGLSTCSGPVVNGSDIDTSTPGAKAFEVSASDQVGNTSTLVVNYNVTYKLCLLYDTGKSYKKGSTVPLRLQLCDAGDTNFSTASITLSSQNLVMVDGSASSEVAPSGNANPDNNFRYDIDLQGYIFNLSTKDLSTGTWALTFTVTGDPLTHTINFGVR
jgi:hypothetical protein